MKYSICCTLCSLYYGAVGNSSSQVLLSYCGQNDKGNDTCN